MGECDFLFNWNLASCHVVRLDLLLNAAGEVKLADFGIGRRLGDASSSGNTGDGAEEEEEEEEEAMASTFVGTRAYMSLERLRGDKYGAAADVWSLGIVLLEALLGAHPLAFCNASLVGLVATLADFPLGDGMGAEKRQAARQLRRQL
jgi:serine/threonine protein kinase